MVYGIDPPKGGYGVSPYGDNPPLSLKDLMQSLSTTMKNIQKLEGISLQNPQMSLLIAGVRCNLDDIKQLYPGQVPPGLEDQCNQLIKQWENPIGGSGKTGQELGEIDNAYKELMTDPNKFKTDTHAQDILRSSGWFDNIRDFTDNNEWNAIVQDYTVGSPSHSDFFNQANSNFMNSFNNLNNTVINWLNTNP